MARLEEFWDVMCDYTHYLWLGVMMMLFLFILSLMSLVFADPGTGSYSIAILNTGLILVFGVIIAGMFWICHQRRDVEY